MFGENLEFELVFSPRALKDLKALDYYIQKRVKKAVSKLTYYPSDCEIIKLKGGKESELRLRVGNWRVVFEYHFSEKKVYVLMIKHRREVYR